jgi:hypothetical protein
MRVVGAMLAILLVAGCTRSNDARPTDRMDASARVACADYARLLADLSHGLVNKDAELRSRLMDINREASESQTPGIASGATAMLHDATQYDDPQAFYLHLRSFMQVCAASS